MRRKGNPAAFRRPGRQLGYDIDTIIQENLTGSTDEQVWQAAQQSGRFLITQDLDFSDIRRFAPGTHGGLLVMRLGDGGREAIYQLTDSVFSVFSVVKSSAISALSAVNRSLDTCLHRGGGGRCGERVV